MPSDAPRRTTRDSSDAPAKAEVEARLTEADLNEEEKEAARRAARHTVDEALKQPGGIPPLFPHKLPESCTVIVEGLPLVGPKQQRCCKVDFNNQVYLRSVRAEEEAARIANGGAQDKHDQLERSSDNDEEDPDGGGLRRRRAKSRRLVEVDAAADAGPDGDGNAEGRKSATRPIDPIEHGASSDPKVVCYPSFVIAGTQKSGTTALTGELCSQRDSPILDVLHRWQGGMTSAVDVSSEWCGDSKAAHTRDSEISRQDIPNGISGQTEADQ